MSRLARPARSRGTVSSLPTPSTLVPPYAFSLPPNTHPDPPQHTAGRRRESPLRPPYTHSLPPAQSRGQSPLSPHANADNRANGNTIAGPSFVPLQRYALLPPSSHGPSSPSSSSSSASSSSATYTVPPPDLPGRSTLPAWVEWATAQLASKHGRESIFRSWVRATMEIHQAHGLGQEMPHVGMHELALALRDPGVVGRIRGAGGVVVRDVVPDSQAQAWAEDVHRAEEERGGREVYWHPALLAARAHPSLLSANSQLLSLSLASDLLTSPPPTSPETYVSVSPVRSYLRRPPSLLPSTNLSFSATPLPSHASFSPISATVALRPASITFTPSIAAATYANLQALFRPRRSMLSFYTPEGYLEASNWRLIEPSELAPPSMSGALSDADAKGEDKAARAASAALPHLDGTQLSVRLQPGDVVYAHPSLPTTSGRAGGAWLSVDPVLRNPETEAWAAQQREAYEAGLPPPAERRGGEMVALEEGGGRDHIPGSGGKRAMGY